MPDCPGETFTVTNQDDADSLNSSPCGSINILQAEGTLILNITGSWDAVSVSSSPGLRVLNFPQAFSLNSLQISEATSLSTLSLPRLIGANISYTERGAYLSNRPPLDLSIANAPELLTFNINTTSFGNLELLGVPTVANDYYVPAGVVTALSIRTDSCLDTYRLEAVGDLTIVGVVDCNYQLHSLESVGNLSITNSANFRTNPLNNVNLSGLLLVNESMILDNKASEAPYPDLTFDRVSQIGGDLNITSHANVDITFDGLTDIGASLVISKNTNCTFHFDHVSTARNLILLDNADSVLPLFPELATVENVHFRGFIDTSTGPNIFPALTLARGTVVVEAWNAEFNCSALESLKNQNKINHLVCNGTNNGTSSDQGSLSPGAKAGIGVGSGIFGLGIVAALAWLILHFRRRLKSLEAARGITVHDDKSEEGITPPEVNGTQEVDGTGIIREMPDDPLVELRVNESELPEDHLHELYAGTT